jgi:hypothetical protein
MPTKALSIQQPWAWLIVNGYKDIENRDWSTSFRGPIAVHAGKTYDSDGEHWVRREFPEIPLPSREQLATGAIVGTANVVGCVHSSPSRWFFGKYGFCLSGARPCLPFAMRGRLGFFDLPEVWHG